VQDFFDSTCCTFTSYRIAIRGLRIPIGLEIFTFKTSSLALESTEPHVEWVTGCVASRLKRSEREFKP